MDKAATFNAYNKYLESSGQKASRCTISGEEILPICMETKCKMYMGLRMTDMFGHINNSRYIEAMEFARWHQMSCTGIYGRMKRAQLFPIVSSLDLQFVREIKPCSTVVIRTQMGKPIGKTGVVYQQIESLKGDVIHAAGIIRFAWLNSQRYRTADGTMPKPGPVSAEEFLLRMGWPRVDVDECLSGKALSDPSSHYFGKNVSSYDKIIQIPAPSGSDDSLVAFQNHLDLRSTFPVEKIDVVNISDQKWRHILRQELKARKESLSRSQAPR